MNRSEDKKDLSASPLKSNQEIFDIVAPALLRQGKKSLDSKGDCAYRGQDGLKCAAGFLIPDEMYESGFEGVSVTGLPRTTLLACGLLGDEYFLTTLQRIHDAQTPDVWADSLRTTAANHNLSTDCIKEWLK